MTKTVPFPRAAHTALPAPAMVSLRFFVAAAWPCLCAALEPAAVYDGGYGGNSSILLSIGNGGAGQSGLIEGEWLLSQSHSVAICN